jgi:hypothetical protein
MPHYLATSYLQRPVEGRGSFRQCAAFVVYLPDNSRLDPAYHQIANLITLQILYRIAISKSNKESNSKDRIARKNRISFGTLQTKTSPELF